MRWSSLLATVQKNQKPPKTLKRSYFHVAYPAIMVKTRFRSVSVPVKVILAADFRENGGADAPADGADGWMDEDRYSFDDSDRFEEDSLCSWSSEPESVCNNWRGWKRPAGEKQQSSPFNSAAKRTPEESVPRSLTELTARCVASHIPFELVERFYPPVPEQIQLRIAFWSFPDNEEDIRLYSCLANGSSDEFQRGELLFRNKAVRDPLQIGFHLSATVVPPAIEPNARGPVNVAVTFDRRRVTSCNCTCNSTAYWCSHVVAVCLHRINRRDKVTLRAPVSESLSRLHRDQLQKFAQYLISELPQQILPTAQRLLDELLSSQPSAINSVCGAPDPTAGASITDQTSWYLDEKALHENINKIMVKFCVPAPIVFSDVNYLTTSAPPAATEWSSLLRPLRGREPEGMWNLLSIVREMYKRSDRNAVPLLTIITEECFNIEQILIWWLNTCIALHSGGGGGRHAAANSNSHASQHACSSLCDEIVNLWRLAALNPALSPSERSLLREKFKDWHSRIIDKVSRSRGNVTGSNGRITAIEVFPGFNPAIQACELDWDDYPLPGITYLIGSSPVYHSAYACFRNSSESNQHQVNSSNAVLNYMEHYAQRIGRRIGNMIDLYQRQRRNEVEPSGGNRSSASSEGFCENDAEEAGLADEAPATRPPNRRSLADNGGADDTDSQEGGSESASSSDNGQKNELRHVNAESSCKMRSFAMKDQSSEESEKPTVESSDDEFRKAESEKIEENRPKEDPWNILFARAEGLHAHGHNREACILAVKLALELLANPPNLMLELPPLPVKGKRRKVNPVSHQMSCLASTTLAKCAFLSAVLTEVPEHHHLAFRVGLFGLEMARPPASTKPLEVKLANQESELMVLVRRIPLGNEELAILRQKAQHLRDGTLRSRGEALLPINLASFIFDAFVGTSNIRGSKTPLDENLAFEAAVSALGLKANVSEADHPLLCEGTRRQRGELAITLLVHYKDEPTKLARIMDKLLDRDIHSLMKTPLSNWYYTTSQQIRPMSSTQSRIEDLEPKMSMSLAGDPLLLMDQTLSGSRPHSTASAADLEQSLSALSLHPPPSASLIPQPPPTRTPKESGSSTQPRYKGKRAYPSIPNQPSEAGAHFMFELAKTVLNKAGGSSSTSLFTQASTSQAGHHGPHRALHICAFQIGLYALGLHNCVSPNWLSRTYSSHVSWITGQAMEIGAVAISFLIDTWEGHLTPPEAASIADRASRGCDPNMVRSAAELALSCLPHAHALNPNEISRAIVQCKEQSELMLEHSCLTVENAAKGGGVYPEVLFQVAKYWFDLYVRHSGSGNEPDPDLLHDSHPPIPLHFTLEHGPHGGLLALPMEPPPPPGSATAPPPPDLPPGAAGVVMAAPPLLGYVTPAAAAAAHAHAYTLHSFYPAAGGVFLGPQFPPGFFLQGGYSIGGMPPPTNHPIQLVPPPQALGVLPGPSPQTAGCPPQAPPPTAVVAQPQHLPPLPHPQVVSVGVGMPLAVRHVRAPPPPASNGSGNGNGGQLRCLVASYRVGMLALETLARRVHDDRPQAKYGRNPPYGDDVKWLLRVSKKLGSQYVLQFCMCLVNSIVSPFVLHEVALEAASYLSRGNQNLALQHLRSSLSPLVTKAQQMYIQCMHQKLYHLSSSDYEDFVALVVNARSAFHILPDGSQQFKEWLQSIKRSKSCKKDLWSQINAALQTNGK